ncbi:MAG: hypothetical protein QM795_14030 [Pseudoxanthomonas sp.]
MYPPLYSQQGVDWVFRSRTVMIIGAGASVDLRLPLGEQLAEEIANLLNFEADEFGHRTRSSRNIEKALQRLRCEGRINDVTPYLPYEFETSSLGETEVMYTYAFFAAAKGNRCSHPHD